MPANIIRNIGYWQHQSGWSRWSSWYDRMCRGPRPCSACLLGRALTSSVGMRCLRQSCEVEKLRSNG